MTMVVHNYRGRRKELKILLRKEQLYKQRALYHARKRSEYASKVASLTAEIAAFERGEFVEQYVLVS